MRTFLATASIAAAALVFGAPAQASLTLTAAGVSNGFVLSTVLSGGNQGNYPFLAGAVLSDGNLAVVDYEHGRLVKYKDVDNQTAGDALASVGFSGAINIANAGGKTYAASQSIGLWEVSSSLGLTAVSVPGVGFSLGLWGAPNGHLLAATNLGITDIDPVAGTHTVINGIGSDGISVSPDGKVVYAASGGQVLGFDVVTHALLHTFSVAGGPDGTGVIAGGALDGHIIVNNNDGSVVEIDPVSGIQTVIATGGLRGDFTTPDKNDGSLLLSSYGAMYRLKVAGGVIGGSAPEPMSLALVGVALFGLALSRRTR